MFNNRTEVLCPHIFVTVIIFGDLTFMLLTKGALGFILPKSR